MIKGRHLAEGSYQVDMKTGKKTKLKVSMNLLPPGPDKCQECAVNHPPEASHNAHSMFYQYAFYNENGRWPTWIDAMAHCSDKTKNFWISELEKKGVDVLAGELYPAQKKRS